MDIHFTDNVYEPTTQPYLPKIGDAFRFGSKRVFIRVPNYMTSIHTPVSEQHLYQTLGGYALCENITLGNRFTAVDLATGVFVSFQYGNPTEKVYPVVAIVQVCLGEGD